MAIVEDRPVPRTEDIREVERWRLEVWDMLQALEDALDALELRVEALEP